MSLTKEDQARIASLEVQASAGLDVLGNKLPVSFDKLPLALQLYIKNDKEVTERYSLEMAGYAGTIGGLLRDLKHSKETLPLLDSEFDMAILNKGKPLVIFFQGFASIMPQYSLCMPWLRPVFAGKSLGEHLSDSTDCSLLLVRDSLQLWYLGGPLGCNDFSKGFHSQRGLDAWGTLLYQYISQCSPSKIIVCGNSAGGTAAITIGNMIGADYIISIAPQGRLFDVEWERQLPYSQFTQLCPWRFAAARELGITVPVSIADLVKRRDSKTTLIIPRNNAGDSAALAHVPQGNNVEVHYVESAAHASIDKNYLYSLLYRKILA